MKIKKLLFPVLASIVLLGSCTKDDIEPKEPGTGEEGEVVNLEVENFIWKGLNEIYLYKADVPELANNYFTTPSQKTDFLKGFGSPEKAFDGLLATQDRFSFIVPDYVSLMNSFAGVNTTEGMEFLLYTYAGDNVFGIVTYVLPNTSAEEEGVKRGDIFTSIDGVKMNVNNYRDLLDKDAYVIDINYLDGNTITPTGKSVSLTKKEYSTNPVYKTEIIEVNGSKVGYLMYNSFTASYDGALNAAFGEFKTAGVTDLVLDLRYNGGGSVATAAGLASMITGQYKGEIFLKEQWNAKYQNAWEPESYLYRFNDQIVLNRGSENEVAELINSLNLNKVYVLTTGRTASASELIINGLEPYIDVVQIGKTTVGKFQASVTLFDSPGMTNTTNVNKNHTYAIQPLVFKSANAEGKSDYVNGLTPDLEISEDLGNMGTLGDPQEPFLKAALNHIAGVAQDQKHREEALEKLNRYDFLGQKGMDEPVFQKMYIEELPSQLEL